MVLNILCRTTKVVVRTFLPYWGKQSSFEFVFFGGDFLSTFVLLLVNRSQGLVN